MRRIAAVSAASRKVSSPWLTVPSSPILPAASGPFLDNHVIDGIYPQ